MLADPRALAVALDALLARLEESLWRELEESGMLPAPAVTPPRHARREWQVLALDAALRGLVAASGFDGETRVAAERLETLAQERWARRADGIAHESHTRERLTTYAREVTALDARHEHEASRRLGVTCAIAMGAPSGSPEPLAGMLGELHASLVDGFAEAVRRGEGA